MFLLGILVLTVDVLAVADDEDNHEYYLVIRVDPGDFSEFAVNMEDATELFGEKDIEAGTETVFNRIAIYNHSIPLSPLYCKVVLYRDTGSVDPGSGVMTNFWLCIWLGDPYFGYLLCKRYFFLMLKIHFVVL